ncbi:unnamed protein product [Chrysodeixis includens]|uniref:Uncharacterized protein n=1 Tax=Chrysodeixis includens TaxID=689277 RepID=A0A9P0BL14_CHRIL|nr:unnamed protein product [Chrysodeixis includens]
MPAVEMYTIIIITVMTMSQGLLQSCFQFCKLSPDHFSAGRPDCDCSAYKQRYIRSTVNTRPFDTTSITKDSGIYYEPAPFNSPLAPSFVQQIFRTSRLPPIPNPTINGINLRQSYDTIDSLVGDDIPRHPPLTTTDKFKRDENMHTEPLGFDEIENSLHLYFDLNLKPENYSNTRLEELKLMFTKFQEAEKGLSECINFHIYIFSKYKDNIHKTNTNWGQVERDNLSRSQELTEIQNKCGHAASIIRQSIFEVKQSYPQKQNSSDINKDDSNFTRTQDILYTNETVTNKNNDNDYSTKTAIEEPGNSPNVVNDVFRINVSEKDLSKSTSYVNMIEDNTPHRALVLEQEVDITKIITKELSNGSITSILDGYEELPNSDFITYNDISSTSEESTEETITTGFMNTNIDKIDQSDLVEIKGNLYFLFGNNHIPARFMQQPGGEINIAMDGFSLCTQMLQTNQSTFMNLLCNCIEQKKCTQS